MKSPNESMIIASDMALFCFYKPKEARRYARHVERENRKARWFNFWKDLTSKKK